MRRYMTRGSLIGLALYLLTWPFWWLVLKSPEQGAQTFLYAAMEAGFERADGGQLLKEVLETKLQRPEIQDEKVQKELWELSDKAIEALEKESAQKRTKEKKEKEDDDRAAERQKAGQPEKQAGSRKSKKAAKDR